MRPTPSCRRAIDRVLAEFRRHRSFIVSAHQGPDGDALGSMLALRPLLTHLGKRVQLAAAGGVQDRYRFLAGAASVVDRPKRRWARPDALVVVDCGSLDRLDWVAEGLPRRTCIINIDHHVSNTRFGRVNWIEPEIGSVGEMVYRLARGAGVPLTRDMARALYVAMVTDNGLFSYSCTSPASHLIAADLLRCGVRPDEISDHLFNSHTPGELRLQAEAVRRMRRSPDGRIAWTVFPRSLYRRVKATPEESQEYVSLLRSLDGVALAMLIRDAGERGKVKVSLRSDGSVDCNRLAQRFGGGGHARAAGCTLPGRAETVQRRVVSAAMRLYRGGSSGGSQTSHAR